MKKCKGSFVVLNKRGLHARPSVQLAKCASTFKAHVTLRCANASLSVDAKSSLQLLVLSATQGTEISVEAEGEDADLAVDTLVQFAKERFCKEEGG